MTNLKQVGHCTSPKKRLQKKKTSTIPSGSAVATVITDLPANPVQRHIKVRVLQTILPIKLQATV